MIELLFIDRTYIRMCDVVSVWVSEIEEQFPCFVIIIIIIITIILIINAVNLRIRDLTQSQETSM